MTPNEKELRPCPFCNDQALPSIRATGYCPNCGACGPEHGEHWNDRPRESELEQALVLAREALESCYNVVDWPGGPDTDQAKAITAIDAALKRGKG